MEYNEEEWLLLSGIQHFSFCRRQWALIHVEHQWQENYRTADGRAMHQNAHDGDYRESRPGCIIVRGMEIHSRRLGLTGACDVVELRKSETGIPQTKREGLWQPYPVEYKRGCPQQGGHAEADKLQLCAQALCLEEMLCCAIPEGALYYGETRHREAVAFCPELRERVAELIREMHALYRRGHTPKVKPTKACNACSLKEICLPVLLNRRSAEEYIRKSWEEEA